MNLVAYLVLRVSKRSGRVRHAQITSEWPVTEVSHDDGTWALLDQAHGKNYQDAHGRMVGAARSRHPWVLPLLQVRPVPQVALLMAHRALR
jgi:hypothetical protein